MTLMSNARKVFLNQQPSERIGMNESAWRTQLALSLSLSLYDREMSIALIPTLWAFLHRTERDSHFFFKLCINTMLHFFK